MKCATVSGQPEQLMVHQAIAAACARISATTALPPITAPAPARTSLAASTPMRPELARRGERPATTPGPAPTVMRPDLAPTRTTGRRQARVKAAPPVDLRPPVALDLLAEVLTDEQILAGYDRLLKLVTEADHAAHKARSAADEYRVQMQARYFADQCTANGVPAR